VLVHGSQNPSALGIPHAASASRSDPVLQRSSGPRVDRPFSRYVPPVTPGTAGRTWRLRLALPRLSPPRGGPRLSTERWSSTLSRGCSPRHGSHVRCRAATPRLDPARFPERSRHLASYGETQPLPESAGAGVQSPTSKFLPFGEVREGHSQLRIPRDRDQRFCRHAHLHTSRWKALFEGDPDLRDGPSCNGEGQVGHPPINPVA